MRTIFSFPLLLLTSCIIPNEPELARILGPSVNRIGFSVSPSPTGAARLFWQRGYASSIETEIGILVPGFHVFSEEKQTGRFLAHFEARRQFGASISVTPGMNLFLDWDVGDFLPARMLLQPEASIGNNAHSIEVDLTYAPGLQATKDLIPGLYYTQQPEGLDLRFQIGIQLASEPKPRLIDPYRTAYWPRIDMEYGRDRGIAWLRQTNQVGGKQ